MKDKGRKKESYEGRKREEDGHTEERMKGKKGRKDV